MIMGDRGQVHIHSGNNNVWLYTHWKCFRMANDVQKAMQKRWRWDDVEYLARIIFDCMKGDDTNSECSWGIGGGPDLKKGDVYHVIHVDLDTQRVTMDFYRTPSWYPKEGWTFNEFTKADMTDEN